MKKHLIIAAFVASIAGELTSVAHADGNRMHMRIIGYASQPIGHYEYCKQYRADCRFRTHNAQPVKLTRERWSNLLEINTFSNNAITPLTDLEIYNREDFWIYPTGSGDCEDYVLMKRAILMEHGWPPSSLLITVVRQSNGSGHAVLTVRTDKADFILDNLSGTIKPWNKTPYTFVKRQAAKHSGKWETIVDLKKSSNL